MPFISDLFTSSSRHLVVVGGRAVRPRWSPPRAACRPSKRSRAIMCAVTGAVRKTNAITSTRAGDDREFAKVDRHGQQHAAGAQGRRLGGGLHAHEEVGHAQHADAGEQHEDAADHDQQRSQMSLIAPRSSTYRAKATVPRNATSATTVAASRSTGWSVSNVVGRDHSHGNHPDQVERHHAVGQTWPADQADKGQEQARPAVAMASYRTLQQTDGQQHHRSTSSTRRSKPSLINRRACFHVARVDVHVVDVQHLPVGRQVQSQLPGVNVIRLASSVIWRPSARPAARQSPPARTSGAARARLAPSAGSPGRAPRGRSRRIRTPTSTLRR